MNPEFKKIVKDLGYQLNITLLEEQLEDIMIAVVKKCAYLVNDQQRTTGYTTHAKMLCKEFGIEYKDEDYYGVE